MLYIFHGTDLPESIKKAHSLIDSLRTKRPDATFVTIQGDSWNPSAIEEHLGGQGLFSSKYIIFLNRVTENSEAKEAIEDFIPAMNESANIFIVLEGKLNTDLKKAFEKHAEKLVVTDKPASASSFGRAMAGEGEFNIFALGDALGMRDPFKAWSIYRQAVDRGLEPESILGTLFWQTKSTALSAKAGSAGEAGVSPFVFSKSKKYASNYSSAELTAVITDIITLYHDGHRGLRNLELSIERLLLNCGKPVL